MIETDLSIHWQDIDKAMQHVLEAVTAIPAEHNGRVLEAFEGLAVAFADLRAAVVYDQEQWRQMTLALVEEKGKLHEEMHTLKRFGSATQRVLIERGTKWTEDIQALIEMLKSQRDDPTSN